MPDIFKKNIIKVLKHTDYAPVNATQLAKTLGVNDEDYEQFKTALEQLHQAGHVVIGGKELIRLQPLSGKITGTFRANPKGFGFVIPRDPAEGDLFIPPDATSNAMTGDVVIAKVKKKGKRDGQVRYSGEIIEILQRAQNRFVGTLTRRFQRWIVQPDGSAFIDPIVIEDISAKGAGKKDKVVVEILSFPTATSLAQGVIIEVLGKTGRYETEIEAIIYQYRLPGDFGKDCLKQARKAIADYNPQKIVGREDITEKVIVTIDPPDAKDFDDAISLEKDSDGNCVLGVHIADVSNFISDDSPLDEEAKNRGNSVYLPGRTIAMLPEVLSNGICSLQPQQKRFAKSAYLTYDDQGNVTGRRFANSVICSSARLTYTQADRILKGHTKGVTPEVIELLKDMERLSRLIEKRRVKNGMLELDLPETEVVMDKSGRVVDAEPADSSYPHTIIEMFMVEANDAVAQLIDRLKVSFLRRIHPEPHALTMKNLSRLVRTLGLALPRTPDRWAIQELLAAVKGSDSSLAVNLMVLRSFEKAQYSPLSIGHYALASTHYCHFTSPIRRYADLLVHRVLQGYLEGKLDLLKGSKLLSKQDLAEVGKHITFTEEQAEKAERELKTVLILQMLSKRIGDELDCVVTGLAGFGVFVQVVKFGVEGLIKIEDLGPGKWVFDAKTHSMVGVNSGYAIQLGQNIKVRIVSVDIGARQLNLVPAERLGGKFEEKRRKRPKKTAKSTKPRKRRGKRK